MDKDLLTAKQLVFRVRAFAARNLNSKYEGREFVAGMEFGKDKFKTGEASSLSPSWNEECSFTGNLKNHLLKHNLTISVYAVAGKKSSECGSISFSPEQVIKGVDKNWYALEKKGMTAVGQICTQVEVTEVVDDKNDKKPFLKGSFTAPWGALAKDQVFEASDNDDSSLNLPEVSGLSPNSGPESGQTRVVIRGADLGLSKEDITELSVAGVDCRPSLVYFSQHKLECVTEPGKGSGPVIVTTKSGGRGSSTVQFTFLPDASELFHKLHTATDKMKTEEMKSPEGIDDLKRDIKKLEMINKEKDNEIDQLRSYIDQMMVVILERNPELLEHISKKEEKN
eukprot:Lithocolla_globosa_v1_NODE_4564_length_1409_cov_6.716396.p1 type:complete len:339 gc:universal NODE_4564_length_1409_cov_6.716396:45-1061(+)